ITPLPVTNTPKLDFAPAPIATVTLLVGAATHTPVFGSVAQSEMLRGSPAAPVSADAVIVAAAPAFDVATENTPAPVGPGRSTVPSLCRVATSATMSGTGVIEAESSRVFKPTVIGAWVPPHANASCTSVGGNA